ncbi:Hypp8113 [Branchiostoma lanceolatum]|uniref:Hypp8113 protein n=1 Tax=Branchiostoma lanceolatum TaxID=7740 RepID=A0A8J9Z7M7_BRALA|nr:Hypp8113 [Branchiostoma lanceolatum]
MADAKPTLNSDQANNLRESLIALITNVNHQLEEIEKLKKEADTTTTDISPSASSSSSNPTQGEDGVSRPTTKLEQSPTKADQPLTSSGTDSASGKEQLHRDSHMNDSSETEKLAKTSGLEELPTSPDAMPENSAKDSPAPDGEDFDPLETLEQFAHQFGSWIERSKTNLEKLIKENQTTEREPIMKSYLESYSYLHSRLDRF